MDKFKQTNILVTGGAGFVGSNLVKRLLTLDVDSVDIVDNLLSAERANIPSDRRVHFIEGSIADNQILDEISDKYDYIFHLSTYHGNQSSMASPLMDHENNLITTLKLLERIKNFKRLRKWVYSGAGCAVAEKTYENAHATPEDAPISLEMDSPYSISKIVGEFYALYFHSKHNVPAVRARFQNVYGPGEILGAGQWRGTPATVWRNVTPTFIYKSLHSESLPLEGGGETSRDFIFVDDIIRGLLLCATKGQPGEVYNLASGVETSIKDLANLINKITGNTAPLNLLPRRNWDHSGRRFGSIEKSLQQLDFKAKTPLKLGLEKTVSWTKENMELIESCMQKHIENMKAFVS